MLSGADNRDDDTKSVLMPSPVSSSMTASPEKQTTTSSSDVDDPLGDGTVDDDTLDEFADVFIGAEKTVLEVGGTPDVATADGDTESPLNEAFESTVAMFLSGKPERNDDIETDVNNNVVVTGFKVDDYKESEESENSSRSRSETSSSSD